MTLRKPLTQDSPEVIWAAGFLEGDGFFSVKGDGTWMIGAGQVNPEPLHRLAEIFELGRIYFRKQDPAVRRGFWTWEVRRSPRNPADIIWITDLVAPWLTNDRRSRIPWLRVTERIAEVDHVS